MRIIVASLNKPDAKIVSPASDRPMGPTEGELVQQVLDGYPGAYAEIFARHRERAFALAFQYLRDREDAKDVVQDAFIKAYQNLKHFQKGRSFGPWLLTIVRNLCIDLMRKRKHESPDGLPEVLPDRKVSPADGSVLKHEVWAALSQLSPQHREIIFLRDYQGHSYNEIAEILRIPLGTVMSRLHHARRGLMAILEPKS
jgi:RNA polymerase sigma-70 factor (ECF subfamily)